MRLLLLLVLLAVGFAYPGNARAASYCAILSGSSGEESYRTKFAGWASRLKAALVKDGFPESNIRLLVEPDSGKPPDANSIGLESIRATIKELGGAVTPGDDLFIFLIGHGSYINKET